MRAALLCAAAAFCALPALADPALRGHVVIDGSHVRLSDLWNEAGPRAGEVIGPAPAPGSSQIIAAAQLAHIARIYGIGWKPAHAGERVVLERPGRALPREEIVEPLRAALAGGADARNVDIEFAGWTTPMVPAAASATVTVERIAHDPATGRFTAVVAILAAGNEPQKLTLTGRAITMIEVPVAVRRLAAGSTVQPTDVRMARLPASRAQEAAAAPPIGRALDRALPAGQPFPPGPLARAPMVRKGEPVRVALTSGGLSLTLGGRALTTGGQGEIVEVLNPGSRAVIQAEVTGPGQARALGTLVQEPRR